MAVYCDGSVRFLSQNISIPLIAAAVSAGLGEVDSIPE